MEFSAQEQFPRRLSRLAVVLRLARIILVQTTLAQSVNSTPLNQLKIQELNRLNPLVPNKLINFQLRLEFFAQTESLYCRESFSSNSKSLVQGILFALSEGAVNAIHFNFVHKNFCAIKVKSIGVYI